MTDILRVKTTTRYSEVVVHNGTAYLSGQVPDNTDADIRGQTEEVLAMIDTVLDEVGTGKSRLLSAQIFLRDIADVHVMNEVWDAWLPSASAPARATVQALLVDKAWKIEIVVVAAI